MVEIIGMGTSMTMCIASTALYERGRGPRSARDLQKAVTAEQQDAPSAGPVCSTIVLLRSIPSSTRGAKDEFCRSSYMIRSVGKQKYNEDEIYYVRICAYRVVGRTSELTHVPQQ